MKKILIFIIGIFLFSLTSAQQVTNFTYDDFSAVTIDQSLWINTSLVDVSGGMARIGTGGIDTNASINSTFSFMPFISQQVNLSLTYAPSIAGQPLSVQTYMQNNTGGRVLIMTTTFHPSFSFASATFSLNPNNNVTGYINGVYNSTFSAADLTPLGSIRRLAIEVRKTAGTSNGEILSIDNVNSTFRPFINNLTFPSNSSQSNSRSQNFSINATGNIMGKTNITFINGTLYLWNINGTLFSRMNKSISNNYNVTNFTVNSISVGNYLWNVLICATENICSFANTNNTLLIGFNENAITYNSTAYETSQESFILNVTLDPSITSSSASLFYGGTSYASTKSTSGSNTLFSTSLDLDLISAVTANSFNWILNLDGILINSSTNTQTVNFINLTICGAAPQNIIYYNISFKNETSAQERVNASVVSSTWSYWLGSGVDIKNLSYSNSNENREYNFCFSPQDRRVNIDLSFSYDNAESEQRTYSPDNFLLSNSSTSTTLFLLPSTSGQYVTFQVINTAQQALSGVEVSATRSGIGTIETGTTDSSGTVTFFLNPNFPYNFVFSKSGFDDFETTITPSQTSYTITLGGSTSTNNTNSASGMSFVILPSQKTLNNRTSYNFNLTLNSSFWQLDSWGFTLQNRSGFVFASNTSTSASGGFLSSNLNTGDNKTIVMNYFWEINGVYNNATIVWGVVDLSGNGLSIFQFFTDLRNYVSLGFFGLDDIGLGIITFFAIFLVTGVMSYKFGINSPASIMAFIFSLTMFFDIGLGLIPNPVGSLPHAPTFLMLVIFIAMFFREMGR